MQSERINLLYIVPLSYNKNFDKSLRLKLLNKELGLRQIIYLLYPASSSSLLQKLVNPSVLP